LRKVSEKAARLQNAKRMIKTLKKANEDWMKTIIEEGQ